MNRSHHITLPACPLYIMASGFRFCVTKNVESDRDIYVKFDDLLVLCVKEEETLLKAIVGSLAFSQELRSKKPSWKAGKEIWIIIAFV